MASFNQSPLGQTSLTMASFGPFLGNDASGAGIDFSTVGYLVDASSPYSASFQKSSYVNPGWRRESKIISAKG